MNSALQVGVDALRANPLRAILSTLGVVMGVGAMVSVLAMGDGVERFARREIERTTDLLSVGVTPMTSLRVDGQLVRREGFVPLTRADAEALAAAVPQATAVTRQAGGSVLAALVPEGAPRGVMVQAVEASPVPASRPAMAAGRWLADADTAVAVLSASAAAAVAAGSGDSTRLSDALGRTIWLGGQAHTVVGVAQPDSSLRGLVAWVPVDDAARALGPRIAASIALTAAGIESVDAVRLGAERWAAQRFGPRWEDEVQIVNRRARAEQTATAMRVFKMLMAAITGVSLLVGGVGIMNVLLASVAERTREIGIRKATGATRRDILLQFLAESVAITGFGAAIGVLLGLAIAFLAAAIMRAQTGAPVQAAITLPTIGFAVLVSILIGLVFGLYPALRAARLSPIEAIRHE